MTAILGYARVSTTGQDLDAQLTMLTAAGVGEGQIFTDKLSGAVNTERPGLAALRQYAREGDTVVVAAIDRLGRSVAEVTRTIADLGERRILLRALREGVDTGTPTGRAVAAIMATLAELELELGRERRAASRDSRRARRLPATKPHKLNAERQDQLRRLAATGEPIGALADASVLVEPLRTATSLQTVAASPSYEAMHLNALSVGRMHTKVAGPGENSFPRRRPPRSKTLRSCGLERPMRP